MRQSKIIIAFIIFFAFVSNGNTQNCYKVLEDISGFDTSVYQTDLENAACELKQVIPAEFQNQFKVYDFGFYSIDEYKQGEFQVAWNEALSGISTDYYLIFGKQTDQNGVYTKFWIDVKLPNTSIFECTDNVVVNNLINEIRVFTELKYSEFNRSPFSYAEAEIAGMEKLKVYINNQLTCCDIQKKKMLAECGETCLSVSESSSLLDIEGYEKFEGFEFESYKSLFIPGSDTFESFGELIVKQNGELVNIHETLSSLSEQLNSVFTPIKVRFTYYDESLCSSAARLAGIKRENEFAFIDVIALKKLDGSVTLRSNVYSGFSEPTGEKAKLLILKVGGVNTTDNILISELKSFLGIGGCAPVIEISDKVEYPIYKRGDILIIIGNDRCTIAGDGLDYCYNDTSPPYGNYLNRTFFGEVRYNWIKQPENWEIADQSYWRSAVVDISSIDVNKIRAMNINTGTAFIMYHALGHLGARWRHEDTFTPPGFMSEGKGVFHILGTKELDEKPDLFNIYNNLDDLIKDPKNKFGEDSQYVVDKICELFN